jgi:hypothetical protein
MSKGGWHELRTLALLVLQWLIFRQKEAKLPTRHKEYRKTVTGHHPPNLKPWNSFFYLHDRKPQDACELHDAPNPITKEALLLLLEVENDRRELKMLVLKVNSENLSRSVNSFFKT